MSYAYDPVGNRLSKTEDGSTTSYQYNAANQMLRAGEITYAYDANGNRVAKTGLDEEAQYEYNANNFLVKYTSAEGRSTRYGYDGLDVLLELAGPKGQHATTYYRANGRIVAQQKFSAAGNNGGYRHRPEWRRLYYTYDALGSVASLSNHKGKSKTRYVYDVFGEVLSGDFKENTYTFTGKRFDVESGTYHFHFRQYDAKVGVWTTPDPIGILGGINLYTYVENNPVNLIDRYGNEPEGDQDQSGGGFGVNGEADDFGEDGYTGPDESAHEAEGWRLNTKNEGSLLAGTALFFSGFIKALIGWGAIWAGIMENEIPVIGQAAALEAFSVGGMLIGVGGVEMNLGIDTAFPDDGGMEDCNDCEN